MMTSLPVFYPSDDEPAVDPPQNNSMKIRFHQAASYRSWVTNWIASATGCKRILPILPWNKNGLPDGSIQCSLQIGKKPAKPGLLCLNKIRFKTGAVLRIKSGGWFDRTLKNYIQHFVIKPDFRGF